MLDYSPRSRSRPPGAEKQTAPTSGPLTARKFIRLSVAIARAMSVLGAAERSSQ